MLTCLTPLKIKPQSTLSQAAWQGKGDFTFNKSPWFYIKIRPRIKQRLAVPRIWNQRVSHCVTLLKKKKRTSRKRDYFNSFNASNCCLFFHLGIYHKLNRQSQKVPFLLAALACHMASLPNPKVRTPISALTSLRMIIWLEMIKKIKSAEQIVYFVRIFLINWTWFPLYPPATWWNDLKKVHPSSGKLVTMFKTWKLWQSQAARSRQSTEPGSY